MDKEIWENFAFTGGYDFDWEDRAYVSLQMMSDILVEIRANPEGFRTLAAHFLEIAYGNFPTLVYQPGDVEYDSLSLQLTKLDVSGRKLLDSSNEQNTMKFVICNREAAADSMQVLFLHYVSCPDYSVDDLTWFVEHNPDISKSLDIQAILREITTSEAKRLYLKQLATP